MPRGCKTEVRVVAGIGAGVAALAGVLCLYPPGEGEESRGELALQAREERGPDARFASVERRVAARERLISELLAGRLSLLQAAARFRDLNNEDEITWRTLRLVFHGASDDEASCLQVLAWVKARLGGLPDGGQPVLERLEAELAKCLRRGDLPGSSFKRPP